MTESRAARKRRRQRLVIVVIVVFALLAGALAGVVAAFADSSDQISRLASFCQTPFLS
ncbi:MAG: hypothetical protein WKF51_02835 [Geodermatophilaceae bacterium]